MPSPEPLLVFRVLDRPPVRRELYVTPTGAVVLHEGVLDDYADRRAVVPVENYLDGAVERVSRLLADFSMAHSVSPSDIRGALLPPAPAPAPTLAEDVETVRAWVGYSATPCAESHAKTVAALAALDRLAAHVGGGA